MSNSIILYFLTPAIGAFLLGAIGTNLWLAILAPSAAFTLYYFLAQGFPRGEFAGLAYLGGLMTFIVALISSAIGGAIGCAVSSRTPVPEQSTDTTHSEEINDELFASEPDKPKVEDLSAVATALLGTCPNCRKVIRLSSANCLNCGAVFGPGSTWKVDPISRI